MSLSDGSDYLPGLNVKNLYGDGFHLVGGDGDGFHLVGGLPARIPEIH